MRETDQDQYNLEFRNIDPEPGYALQLWPTQSILFPIKFHLMGHLCNGNEAGGSYIFFLQRCRNLYVCEYVNCLFMAEYPYVNMRLMPFQHKYFIDFCYVFGPLCVAYELLLTCNLCIKHVCTFLYSAIIVTSA